MNGLLPVVRCMVLCEDIRVDPGNPARVSLDGVLSNIRPQQSPPYPYTAPVLCVFILLTECRAPGTAVLRVVHPDSAMVFYQSPAVASAVGNDPLVVHGLRFRILNVRFTGRPLRGRVRVQ